MPTFPSLGRLLQGGETHGEAGHVHLVRKKMSTKHIAMLYFSEIISDSQWSVQRLSCWSTIKCSPGTSCSRSTRRRTRRSCPLSQSGRRGRSWWPAPPSTSLYIIMIYNNIIYVWYNIYDISPTGKKERLLVSRNSSNSLKSYVLSSSAK